jgi:osmotically-inducible protein OsmY
MNVLEREGIVVASYASTELGLEALTESTGAVIAVPTISGASLSTMCRKVKRASSIPVFAVGGPMSRATLIKIYKEGAEAVFLWPADREPLVRTIFRIRGPRRSPRGTKSTPQEMALEELVEAHLRADATDFGKTLTVRVKNRLVTLFGRIDALWKVKAAETIAMEVPGVEDVFPDGIIVTKDEDLTDRSIANAARQVLKHTIGVGATTLAVAVRDGCATLTGTAANRAELDRAIDLVSHVRGVQKLENWVVVDTHAKRKDQQVTAQLRDAIAVRYPRATIEVSVFGGVAVLSGIVKTVAERHGLTALAYRQDGVGRVVDKLRVRRASKR